MPCGDTGPLLSPLPPGSCSPQRLLNWMLALACERGHLGLAKLLVLTHGADPESYAVRKNEFPVIVRLPLYAAIKSGGSPVSPARDTGRAVGTLGVLFVVPVSECQHLPSFPSPHPARGFHGRTGTGHGGREALQRAESHTDSVTHGGVTHRGES